MTYWVSPNIATQSQTGPAGSRLTRDKPKQVALLVWIEIEKKVNTLI